MVESKLLTLNKFAYEDVVSINEDTVKSYCFASEPWIFDAHEPCSDM